MTWFIMGAIYVAGILTALAFIGLRRLIKWTDGPLFEPPPKPRRLLWPLELNDR